MIEKLAAAEGNLQRTNSILAKTHAAHINELQQASIEAFQNLEEADKRFKSYYGVSWSFFSLFSPRNNTAKQDNDSVMNTAADVR